MTEDTREEPVRPGAGGLPRGARGLPRGARGRHRTGGGRGRALAAGGLAVLAVLSLVLGIRLLGRAPEVRAADIGTVPAAAAGPAATDPAATNPAPTSPAATTPAPRPPARTTPKPRPRATPTVPPPAPPARFRLSGARVGAPVVPVGVRPDGELRVPEAPREVGWWVGSAPAGAARGSTVLVGHVDSARDGIGTFAALRDVAVGARVELADAFGGTHPYRVEARRTYPKYALPRDVFRVGGDARLVLITCGGPFDSSAGRYRDNVVVYAVPAR